MEFSHKSVLLWECIDALNIRPNGIYLDGTLGGGGHSLEICRRLTNGRLIGVDRDEVALEAAKKRLSRHARKVTLVHDNFENIALILDALNLDKIDGMLFDLGVSSPQLDDGSRGFSYMADAPLDMRMNQRGGLTAAKVVNSYPAQTLTQLLGDWGELDTPWKVANCIVRAREAAPIETTAQLVEAVRPCTPKKDESKFLTKLFQALRIEVNGEMEALKMALEQSLRVLRPGGRLVVISYHSLEDRLVKNFMRSGNFSGQVEKDFFGRSQAPFDLVTRKAVTPSAEELHRNPRSRSAKLPAAVKR